MPLDTSIPLQVQMPQFAEPIDPATRQFNALRQQALQQEMMRNQLIMQNTMEDRRLAAATRAQAAATAAAEQRRKQELAGIYSQFGVTPAAIGQRGASYSGTDVSTNPFEPVRNQLVQRGFLPQAADIAELENKTLTGAKAKAELPGIEAESREKGTKAKVAELDAAVSRYIPAVRGVSTPDDAMRLTDALYEDPTLGPLLSRVAPREQARAQAAQEFAADPTAFMRRHLLTGKELYDATTAAQELAQPKVTVLPPGAIATDLNPASPTYGQPVARGEPVKKTELEAKTEAKTEARKSTDKTLDRLLGLYTSLNEMGFAPTETKSWLGNIPAQAVTSRIGRAVNASPQAQTLIQQIRGLRQDLVRDIKNATGMSAQEMNSNVELQSILDAATDPNQNIEAVLPRLVDFSERYGTGKITPDAISVSGKPATPASTTATPSATESRPTPKTAKLSDIEHTAKVNNLSVEEVKKRVRAMGMAIEGE